ncbi:hypothetical protein [Sporosarcina pasteurii]|uniref:Uncharacterized protein n=1 Tax=Sporosarcina pasteurii TaxID=1474 RepID=A0A380C1Y1_SPOPA|nr:hypothetical protein [Sporosarcina pasteurii]MDS9471515.1 hypothetical protein [Sporosarcina pasteurii]QBQ04865.1 hypothetical protein E2C16_03905 [Sporosarcina pasteurii]SUJ10626.1 Uncharacterised protein [Sporosarcina pasteurii]
MKATFRTPKTNKGWFGLMAILAIILLGSWPVIPLLNKTTILFGMPVLMVWSVALIILTTSTLMVLNKIGVND